MESWTQRDTGVSSWAGAGREWRYPNQHTRGYVSRTWLTRAHLSRLPVIRLSANVLLPDPWMPIMISITGGGDAPPRGPDGRLAHPSDMICAYNLSTTILWYTMRFKTSYRARACGVCIGPCLRVSPLWIFPGLCHPGALPNAQSGGTRARPCFQMSYNRSSSLDQASRVPPQAEFTFRQFARPLLWQVGYARQPHER